ncbi:helix-turn-helix transcriptional regulator [Geodermatophilus ruber]|uniref:DNA-binding transcriptional regulator, CsgD family n=1 Tax=Geodermatophilus ruber TaxID=504800 RepID=A0A1I4EVT6_9ACTN|nr:helix-turn-helix transcriptional regulator [Geodermatophilus ruber]SFL09828.1 DNA-binding transcriptional regulator, CsgD family [Geodermatophilus ruber]
MGPAEILREFTRLAAEPGGPAVRAEALLSRLQQVVPFDAGAISLLSPDQDAHATLFGSGYDERVRDYLDSPALLADLELVGLRRSHRAVRLGDLLVPPSELVGWAEYLEPAGFRDGVAAGLFTAEGHYLGLLGLNTEAAGRITDTARDLLGLLATPIATGVDPWRSLAAVARVVDHATAGTVLTPSGAVQPLPGLPGHRLLTPGSGVLSAATAQLADGGSLVSFLAPLPVATGAAAAGDGAGTHLRITALAVPPDVRRLATAVVLAGPVAELHGLSAQELQVLGLLVTGASNERIAAALGITRRTVDGHVDHVRAKLAARSRTAAAARALRLGLFVPPALFVRRSARVPEGRPPP